MILNRHSIKSSVAMMKATILAGTLAIAGAAGAAPMNVQAGNGVPLLRGSQSPVIVEVGPGKTAKPGIGKVHLLGGHNTAHVRVPLIRGPKGKQPINVRVGPLGKGAPRR